MRYEHSSTTCSGFDISSGSIEKVELKAGEVHLDGKRYRCSEYFWELWRSGYFRDYEPHDVTVDVQVNRADPRYIQMEVCGHREICSLFIDPYALYPVFVMRKHRVRRLSREASHAPADGVRSLRTGNSAALLRPVCMETRSISTLLRTQAGKKHPREHKTRPRHVWKYSIRVKRAIGSLCEAL